MLVGITILVGPRSSAADQFCAPPLSQLPDTQIPGFDAGPGGGIPGCGAQWLGAFRKVIGFGTTQQSAVVQMLQGSDGTGPLLYMTTEIPGAPGCTASGFIVAFDTGGSGVGKYKKIEVFPWATALGGACANATTDAGTQFGITYYPNGQTDASAGQINWGSPGSLPSSLAATFGFQAPACDTSPGATYVHLELQIPVTALGLPTTGTFKMFWAVIADETLPTQPDLSAAEYTWPIQCQENNGVPNKGCIAGAGANLCIGPDPNNPIACATPDTWGQVSLDPSQCQGVSISGPDITVSNPATDGGLTTDIQIDGGNTFHALVRNNGQATATRVRAEFRIANFGSQFADASWIPIQNEGGVSVGNPTDPANGTIDGGGGTKDLTIGPWTPQPGLYTDTSDPHGLGHQCVLVQLTSDTNTTFTSASAFTNMQIGAVSPFGRFQHIAEIQMGPLRRFGPIPMEAPGRHLEAEQTAHLAYFVQPVLQYAYGDGSYPGFGLGRVGARVNWYFTPYLPSGQYVNVPGKKAQLVFPGPAFGYAVDRDMGDAFQQPFTQRHQALWDDLDCRVILESRAGKPPKPAKPAQSGKGAKKVSKTLAYTRPAASGGPAPPVFTPVAMTRTTDFRVALTSSPGARICYTTDGVTIPACNPEASCAGNSMEYNSESPITVQGWMADANGNVTIKALACTPNTQPTAVVSEQYTRCLKAPDPRFFDALNERLASDKERPAPNDFQLRVDGMIGSPGGPPWPSWYTIDVAANGTVLVGATGAYGDASLPPPPPLDAGAPDSGGGGTGEGGGYPDGGGSCPNCPIPRCSCDSTADTVVSGLGALTGLASFAGLFLARRSRRRHVE
jgi:hypothetical protein